MSEDLSSKLEKTRAALYRSQDYLWKSCIKNIKKDDVWEVELQYYHIILRVAARKLRNGNYLGFLRYKIKGLEQWQDFVNVISNSQADEAKQHTILNFLSFLKSDDVQAIYGNPPLVEPELPKLSAGQNYQIQYELDGRLIGPPTDLVLTPYLQIVKLSGYNSNTFRVLVTGKSDTKELALKESKKILMSFLDYYCVRTLQTIKILNDGKPHSIKFNNISDMELDFSLNYFIPDESKVSPYYSELHMIESESGLHYIQNAIKYYRKARTVEELEEKLVNYFIALEALYSKNEQEITFRFSIRISCFLGTESGEIAELLELAQEYYRKRSTAVHGEIVEIDRDVIDKIDSWVRRSILYFIEISTYFPNRNLAINAIDYAVIDFEFRDLLRNIIEPVNSVVNESSNNYQHEFE